MKKLKNQRKILLNKMGCDIHWILQESVNGKWEKIKGVELDLERNYDAFATLANVRNNGNITPISQPKGYPKDSPYYMEYGSDDWDWNYHSHTYFTLHELLNYNYTTTTRAKEYIYNQILAPFKRKIRIDELNDNSQYSNNVRILLKFDN